MTIPDTVHVTNPNESDFPSIDQMRREGKVIVTKSKDPMTTAKLIHFIQASIRRGMTQ